MVLDSQRLETFHSSDGDETAASVEFHKSWGRVYLDKEEKLNVDGETVFDRRGRMPDGSPV